MIKISDILDMTDVVITQEYGVPWARNPEEMHNGIDLNAKKFAVVRFPIAGIVTRANYHFVDPIHALGNRISLFCQLDPEKDQRYELYLCHLDGINPLLHASSLDGGYPRVQKGDLAGRVGASGSCVGKIDGGVHIHLGVRSINQETWEATWLDPKKFIDFTA